MHDNDTISISLSKNAWKESVSAMQTLLQHANEMSSKNVKSNDNISDSILTINKNIFGSISKQSNIDWDDKLNNLSTAEFDDLIKVRDDKIQL